MVQDKDTVTMEGYNKSSYALCWMLLF